MSVKDQHDPKSKSKRKRSQTPDSTTTSYNQTDLSEGPSGENTNKRVRFERASSPAPSHLSLKSDRSIDLPTNFRSREPFPFDSREKLKRPASPASSYLSFKTDWSMDLPTNFKGREAFHLDTITGSERPPSPTLSSVSEWTELFIQPTDFKAEAAFNLDPRLLTENHLKCPVCKSMLKDPVSIPCGHNFCRDCINKFWDSCTEEYVCSECGRGSKARPELHTNTALVEVVKNLQQAAFSPALPPCSYAGPEDVACDFCTERRLKAVKSCLTCNVLLCETHIRSHYTIPALQKHTLSDVTGAMEKKYVPAGNSSSGTVYKKKNHTDKTPNDKKVKSSVVSAAKLKTKCPKKSQRTSKPKSRVIEDTSDVSRLQIMYSTLQQELSGLKKSFSEFSKKKKTKKEKSYDVDKRNYEKKEDDNYSEKSSDASDDDEGEEDDFDEKEEEDGFDSEEEEDDEKDGSDSEEEEDYEEYGFDSEEGEDDEEDGSDSEEEEDKNYSYDDDDYDEENNSEDYYKDFEERSDEEDRGDEEERSEDYYEGTSEGYNEKDIYEDYEHSSNDEDNYSDYGF